jgi:hypothetical protein
VTPTSPTNHNSDPDDGAPIVLLLWRLFKDKHQVTLRIAARLIPQAPCGITQSYQSERKRLLRFPQESGLSILQISKPHKKLSILSRTSQNSHTSLHVQTCPIVLDPISILTPPKHIEVSSKLSQASSKVYSKFSRKWS